MNDARVVQYRAFDSVERAEEYKEDWSHYLMNFTITVLTKEQYDDICNRI
jgi:hypothetical protein